MPQRAGVRLFRNRPMLFLFFAYELTGEGRPSIRPFQKHRAGKPGEPADWKVYPTRPASGAEHYFHQPFFTGVKAFEPTGAFFQRGRGADKFGDVDLAAGDQVEAL